MPFCPDCGLCFASVNSVRMHRASGNCVPAGAARKPNVAVPAPLYGRGRYALPVNGVPATEQELDQLLALQNAQQEAELAKREKMLLDQQINLVLPARQAQLQQGQEALKEQVMQLKLNMLTQEQMKAQGSNLEMEYLHNELNAVQEALRQIRVPAPPAQPAPTGAYHHPHALPQKGGGRKNEEQTASSAVRSRHQSPRTGKAQTPPPPTNAAHDRRSRRHNHHGSRNRKGQAANERKGFSKGRHSRRANRRGRNDEDEDEDSVSHSSGSASSSEEYDDEDDVRHNGADSTSWSSTSTSEDEEDSSSLSGSDAERPYRKGRNHKVNRRQRTRRGKRDSIGLTSQTARLPLRPAATAAAVLNGRKSHTANDTGSRHHYNALTPRAAPPLRPSAGYAEKDANYEENRRLDKKYTKALQKLPKPLRHVVQSLRDEVAELRASQLPSAREDSPPFPTSSSLPAGQYKLNLASLSGLDLTVPLEDIELSVKLYYMVNRAGAFMLDPMHEHTFARQPPPLTRQSSTLLLFTTAPIEFTVTNDEDLIVAVLQLRYRGQLLYWATVFTRQSGAWTEPLRPPPFDLANALQSPDDVELYLPYVMGGTIEPDKRDLLAQAEEYMHEAGLENALVSRVLRGLPPLPPLPPGMTLLPGMPGNEGPFLPPQPNAILYGNSNNHNVNSAPGAMTTASGATPATTLPHFTLPPPQGMTIVQWNALLRQHLERGATAGTTPQRRQSSSTSAVPGSAQAMFVAPVAPSVLKPPTPQTTTLNPLPVARKASVTPAVTQKEAPKQTPVTAPVTAVQPAVVSRMSEAPQPVTTTTTTTTTPSPAAQPPCPATTQQQQSAQPQATNKPVSPSVTVVPPSAEQRPTVTTTTTSPTPTPAPGPRSTPETQSAAAAALPVKTATMSATPEPQQQTQQAAQAERNASLSPPPVPSQPTSRPTTPHATTNEAQAASPKRPASARQSTVQIQEQQQQQQRGGQTSSPPLPQAPGGSLMVAPNARMQQHPTSPGSLLRPSSARQNPTQPNGQRQGQTSSPPPPADTSSAGPAMAAAAARRQSMQQPQQQQDTSPGAPNRQPQGQQQQQQPAGSGEAGAGKVPLVDRPLVAQMQLRPILDNTGNLAVPRGYKDAKNPPSCILLDRFDVSSNVSISVQLGLAKPTDTRPQPLTFAGHGPDKRDVNVFFDGVVGVPLDADCVRLLVYCLNGVDPATGKPVHVLPDPHSLMRKPDLIAYQDFSSSTASPKFTAQLSTKIDQNTCALVIVEYCVAEKENPLVLGHVCLPIHQKAAVGNYAVRLRLGDPRRSHERDPRETRPAERLSEEQRKAMEQYDQAQLEASVNAQALRNLLPTPPMKRAECVPAGFLIWRLESGEKSAPYFDLPDQLPLSQQELAIMKARSAHNGTPPSVRSIGNVKEAEESFVGRSMPVGDGLSTLVPYSPERGIFVRVEGVSGVGDAAAFYAVVVHARKVPASASNTRPVQIASVPDWMSDVGAPRFKDPPFVFAGVPYDPTATVVFTLLRLRLQITPGKQVPLPPVHVEHVGWTITKLFLATPNTARQGCFALPWLAGRPSPELLAEVDQKLLDTVYVTALKSKAIQFVAPRATLRISQGDPACAAALVDVLPGKPQTRPILIPNATRREFPIYTNEGMVGCTLQHAHEYCTGKGDPNAFVKALRDAVQNYLQKEM